MTQKHDFFLTTHPPNQPASPMHNNFIFQGHVSMKNRFIYNVAKLCVI